jgi:hypothetical protein
MKAIWFTLALLLLQMPLARSAEYQGKTLDGRTFPAQIYSYETGGIYDAQVQFNQNRATIKFPEGGQFIVKLQHTVITDPAGIEALGAPGRIPLGNSFSVGLSGAGISDNLFPNTPNPLTSFWRISIDLTQLD